MRAGVLLLLLACARPPASPVDRALDFIFSKQREDGSWRSEQYQAYANGHALTPFLLYAASHVDASRYREKIDRAVAFVVREIEQEGALGVKEGEIESPNYASALAVSALVRLNRSETAGRLVQRPLSCQLSDELGWTTEDPEYGGWDYGGVPPKKPMTLRPDISVTAFVLEALRDAGVAGDHPVWSGALRFVSRCRASDGGYFFTPHKPQAFQNKAGDGRSYGTATCDGLRCLLACGISEDDERVRAARARLSTFDEQVPGLKSPWASGLTYYWAFGLSRVGLHPVAVRDVLYRRQRPDGSWVNSMGIMKEDDPLISTGLALASL
jgi:squalene-hopene/tetraprenyl-beta-curcumene cyclase